MFIQGHQQCHRAQITLVPTVFTFHLLCLSCAVFEIYSELILSKAYPVPNEYLAPALEWCGKKSSLGIVPRVCVLTHDLLFFPISTIESRVRKRVVTHSPVRAWLVHD